MAKLTENEEFFAVVKMRVQFFQDGQQGETQMCMQEIIALRFRSRALAA